MLAEMNNVNWPTAFMIVFLTGISVWAIREFLRWMDGPQ